VSGSVRPSRAVASRDVRALALLSFALLVAGCGSKASSSPPTVSSPVITSSSSSQTSTMSTTVATTTRKAAPPPKLVTIFAAAGKGPQTTKLVAAPKGWQLQWGWTCHGKRGSFTVTAHGGSAGAGKKLFTQAGIGGGGQRAFPVSGTFSLTVQAKAACPWSLKIVK
jgi:hypothetical protein